MVTISGLKVAVLGPRVVVFSSRGSAPHPAGAPAPDPGWGSRPRPRQAPARPRLHPALDSLTVARASVESVKRSRYLIPGNSVDSVSPIRSDSRPPPLGPNGINVGSGECEWPKVQGLVTPFGFVRFCRFESRSRSAERKKVRGGGGLRVTKSRSRLVDA